VHVEWVRAEPSPLQALAWRSCGNYHGVTGNLPMPTPQSVEGFNKTPSKSLSPARGSPLSILRGS
jgi:hypothetical protein